MRRLAKPQPPLTERLAKFYEAKQREYKRLSESETPAAQGHAWAIADLLESLELLANINGDEGRKAALVHVQSHLDTQRNYSLNRTRLAIEAMREPGVDDEPTRERDFYRAATVEFTRLSQEVKNLLNPIPEDML